MPTLKKKILVIGCPGSGKSTFSRKLHEKIGIPLFHLDMMYWNPDRTTVEKSLFLERLTHTLKKEEWILDGNYASTLELRLNACDTVVFLDFPTKLCLQGVRERRGKPRSDIPWTEKEGEEDKDFLAFIENFNAVTKPVILKLLKKHTNKEIFIFTSREESDDFLESLGTMTLQEVIS